MTNVCRPDALQATNGQSVVDAASTAEPKMRSIVLGVLAELAAEKFAANNVASASDKMPSHAPQPRALERKLLAMHPAEIIACKRDGGSHSPEEIAALVRGFISGEVHDYQMSAWTMAVYLRGLNVDETLALTEAMLRSGEVLTADATTVRVDKHSTGGMGDKSSFIVAPLLACCGLKVPMISGRGLGATGGTLDKLESIPGVRTDLSIDEIRSVVDRVGCVITGATATLVPADRRLYALRDVTATVSSIPLITASILSKKLAESLTALVLDVKYGSGAFMKTRDQARAVGPLAGRDRQPAGIAHHGTADLHEPAEWSHGRRLGGNRRVAGNSGRQRPGRFARTIARTGRRSAGDDLAGRRHRRGRATLIAHLDSGRALEKFREMVTAQGGDLDAPRRRAPTWALESRRGGLRRGHGCRAAWPGSGRDGRRPQTPRRADRPRRRHRNAGSPGRAGRARPAAHEHHGANGCPVTRTAATGDLHYALSPAPASEPLIAERIVPGGTCHAAERSRG